MEISNEIKAKVFAQYLGQKVEVENKAIDGDRLKRYELTGASFTMLIFDKDRRVYSIEESSKLILKPLSSLTEEHYLKCAEICHISTYEGMIPNYKDHVKRIFASQFRASLNFDTTIKLAQFLTSEGYDLPNYLLNGKTLFECNLCIYE